MIAWFAAQSLVFKIVLGGLGSLLILFLLWRLWVWLRKYLEWQNVKTLEIKERVGLKIEFIKTAAQILGGLFFLVTIYVAWQNLVVSQEKHKTDLFTQAINQLGSEKLEVRLGGIYALERIARDSEKDHGPIMEVLTAFVRLHAPWTPKKAAEAKKQQDKTKKTPAGEKKSKTEAEKIKPRADIQAILTVLGRRARTYGKGEAQRLDLRRTDLRGADLIAAHLEGANLQEAHLERADLASAHLAPLEEAHLQEVVFIAAHLEGANLKGAHLEGAVLNGVRLEKAVFREANLEGANLFEAHLEGADLRRAHLEEADLTGAYMKGAKLIRAHLEGADIGDANLEGANLKGADLTGAKELTKEQIASAITDETTKLPDYLKPAGPGKAKPQ